MSYIEEGGKVIHVDDCPQCDKPMILNISNDLLMCFTYGCSEFGGEELQAEDLVALGCPEWVAERMEALSDAVSEMTE